MDALAVAVRTSRVEAPYAEIAKRLLDRLPNDLPGQDKPRLDRVFEAIPDDRNTCREEREPHVPIRIFDVAEARHVNVGDRHGFDEHCAVHMHAGSPLACASEYQADTTVRSSHKLALSTLASGHGSQAVNGGRG